MRGSKKLTQAQRVGPIKLARGTIGIAAGWLALAALVGPLLTPWQAFKKSTATQGAHFFTASWPVPGSPPARPQAADILLWHGRVYTSNPAHPWAEAVAVRAGRIVAVGTDAQMSELRGPGTRLIDLGGRMAMPGVIDSHIHFLEGSLSLAQLSLDDAGTLDEVKRRIREYAAAHPHRAWLVGHGWYYPVFRPLPTKQILDELVPDRPVALTCYDGHSVWVNSKALALAGITRETPDPPNGIIVRDSKTGEPSGVLKEDAQELVEHVIPEPAHIEKLAALRRGLTLANRHGLTSVLNATGSLEEMALYDELRRAGELTVRMRTAMVLDPNQKLDEQAFAAFEGARSRFHDEWVSAGLIKAFMDGVVESHTAAMLAPYADDLKASGALKFTPEQFRDDVVALDRRGFQLMTHAIGDRAVRVTLDAYQAAQEANAPRDRRFRIEHIEIIAPADIPRFGRLGVIASMQPYHAYPDTDTTVTWADAIGRERLPWSFAWRDLVVGGARLAFGSDWPVVSLDPFIGIQNAVTRQDDRGQPAGGWVGRQKVTLEQALAAYTRGAAYAEFADGERGSLEPGKFADLIVLSQDLFRANPLDISKTRVELTMVGGKIVYRAPNALRASSK